MKKTLPRMKIVFSPTAQKKIAKLPKSEKNKVIRNIRKIALEPRSGKKLKGKLVKLWIKRAWPYRIVYKISGKVLIIVTVEHRQKAYK